MTNHHVSGVPGSKQQGGVPHQHGQAHIRRGD
jgi:hypothetical protein